MGTNGTEVATPEMGLQIGKGFSLVPQSLNEAIELAKLISESDLAPKDFKGKPGNTLIAVQMGAEIGISPMQAIQNIAVINGKPSIYGDMGKALLLSKGCRIEERDTKEIKLSGEAWCKITRPDGSPATVRTYSIDNAKEAGLWGKQGPWTTNPWRQMAWRAFWFAARDGAADMLRGLAGVEEVRDYIETEVVPNVAILTPQPAKEEQRITEIAPTYAPSVQTPQAAAAPRPAKERMRAMDAKMAGACRASACNKKIAVGEPIYYDGDTRSAYHASCC